MLKKIWDLRKDELLRGSFILFVMINIFNFLNYIFHFTMARMLSTSDYGVLAVLMSFIYVFSIPTEAIQTIASKYTRILNKSQAKIKDFFIRITKKAIKYSTILFILFLILSIFFASFLNIDYLLLALTGAVIFVSFISPILRGVLQGEKKFIKLGLNMDLESLSKIILAVVLVYIMKNVYGAVLAVILSLVISIVVALFYIKNILIKKRKQANIQGIYSYSWPALILFSTIILMLSLDIILAKRFFSPEIAGQYAVASMLGKVIFFGTSGIGKAMFPIITEKKKDSEKKNIFRKALIIIGSICLISMLIYYIFPRLVIKILFGSKYIEVSNILIYMSIAYSLLSITNLIVLNKLTHERIKIPYFMVLFIILQIILLSILNQNLINFSLALVIANLLMLMGCFFIKKIEK